MRRIPQEYCSSGRFPSISGDGAFPELPVSRNEPVDEVVDVAELPPPPDGYEISRVDVVVRLRKSAG